jgi:4-carboxymuconolactone decarboxylase
MTLSTSGRRYREADQSDRRAGADAGDTRGQDDRGAEESGGGERSPELMDRVQRVGEYIRFRCPLDKRINELAAAMTARHWTQQFEWWAHRRQALEAGLKPAVAEAIAEGRRPTGMAEDEEVVYDFLTELLVNKGVCDVTYERALRKFGEAGLIDLIAVSGYYGLLAMVMNATRTAVPEGSPLPLVPLPQQVQPA